MNIRKTEIEGLLVIEPDVFGDSRGYFFESYNKEALADVLPETEFVQDNESRSVRGVVRGLHYQKGEHAQAKLVRVVSGRVLDVAVDIRQGSPTFGKYAAVELSGENHRQVFIPKGFAHGFSVLSEDAVLLYKCDSVYCPDSQGGIAWDDPDLGIDWRIPHDEAILSDKDRCNPPLKEIKDL